MGRLKKFALAGICLMVSALPTRAADDEWVQLFNGKDLTGWKIHPTPNREISEITAKKEDGKTIAFEGVVKGKKIPLWRVENGTIIGGGPATHLFTERGDYENFHFRVEAKVNDHGNSGQYFRTAFGPGFPT